MSSRTQLTALPFYFSPDLTPWEVGHWPVSWLQFPTEKVPAVAAFRLRFSLESAETIRIHVSADERYELFLNGARIGIGPERSTPDFWAFETFDLGFAAGENVLVARVQRLGEFAPAAQLSSDPGFLLAPDDAKWLDVLGTGHANWETKVLGGYKFEMPEGVPPFVGAVVEIDGAHFDWGFEKGEGDHWQPAVVGKKAIDERFRSDFEPRPILRLAALQPQLSQRWNRGQVRYGAPISTSPTDKNTVLAADSSLQIVDAWQNLWDEKIAVSIAPHTRQRIILDLEDYVCAYPILRVSGGRGALVRWYWQEAYLDESRGFEKGQRDEIEGKRFATRAAQGVGSDGMGDFFRPDGEQDRLFEVLHWRCGRFIEICVETGEEALEIGEIFVLETRYPLENEGQFSASDARFAELTPILVRVMQMCAHESYMDCPFYEQLQYVGDTRLEVLTTFAMTLDDALPRQALRAFDRSRLVGGNGNGLTQSRVPSRVRQVIPPFSMWWTAMVHDLAMWRGDGDLVRELLPGVRAVLDAFRGFRNAEGLVEGPPGWNFGDWARDENGRETWPAGMPPEGQNGVSALFNWQFALVLRLASELETHFGDDFLAQRHLRDAKEVAKATHAAFWNESRGLWADDASHQNWSEHTQCLAILSELAPPEATQIAGKNLLEAPDLTRATIYFSHYLLETFRVLKRPDALLKRLENWFILPAQGFKTTPEQPEPTRSDCHAWGAHPLFHFYASVLGIRPTAPGFLHVEIEPQLGHLKWAEGVLPTPHGEIFVRVENGEKTGTTVILPEGIEGEVILRQGNQIRRVSLRAGENSIS